MDTHTDVALLRDPVIVGFAAWLAEESGFARRTHRTYNERVATYLAWLTESGEHTDALDDRAGRDRAVGAYLADARGRELAPATINVTLAALSALYTWLGLGEPTAARASDPQVPLRVLDPTEQRALLTAAAEGPRAMALVTLGLDVGPRESELVALDIDALDLTEHPGSIEIADSAGGGRARCRSSREPAPLRSLGSRTAAGSSAATAPRASGHCSSRCVPHTVASRCAPSTTSCARSAPQPGWSSRRAPCVPPPNDASGPVALTPPRSRPGSVRPAGHRQGAGATGWGATTGPGRADRQRAAAPVRRRRLTERP